MQTPSLSSPQPTRSFENALPWPGTRRFEYPRPRSPEFDPEAHPTRRKAYAPDDVFFTPSATVPSAGENRAEMVMFWFRGRLAAGIRPDAASCSHVFRACRYDGRGDLAIRLLDDLMELGVHPGISNFNLAIRTCQEEGLFDTMTLLFRHLARYPLVWGTQPDKDTCHALIAASNAVHQPEKAAALLLVPGLPLQDVTWRAVADTTAFQEMLDHCSPRTASRLLARGITAGTYRNQLGFSKTHNVLDLRRRSILKNNISQNRNNPVHPGLAKAVLEKLWASGLINRDTCYAMGYNSPQLRYTIKRWCCEHDLDRVLPFRPFLPAPLSGGNTTGAPADPETRSPPSAGHPSPASPNPAPGQ